MAMTRQTMALAHYDRTAPFFDGAVVVEGADFQVLDVGESGMGRHGNGRHGRMLRGHEFAVAEMSLSSYLMALERGEPFCGVPVFPRRLFSPSQLWCTKGRQGVSAAELKGKRVGLHAFQTTLSVLAKADLKRLWDLDWRDVNWVVTRGEVIDFTPPAGAQLSVIDDGRDLAALLLDGELDALFSPHPTRAMFESPEVVRFFEGAPQIEERYARTFGYMPVMHLVVVREDVIKAQPDLARALFDAFGEAFAVCRSRWDDPNWSWLAQGRRALEAQEERLGNLWVNGVAQNRDNLAWFIEQELDQGLIRRHITVDELFHPSVRDT